SSYPAITLTVSVANNAPASVTNVATVSGGGELNTANDSASDPTIITQVADLAVSKTHSGNFTVGDAADSYTITVSNVGPGPTTVQTIAVTVQTNPSGLSFTVDGNPYTTTQIFQWIPGSAHTIATTSPQSGGVGTQYVWLNWSDGGAISHSVTGPASPTTYTA